MSPKSRAALGALVGAILTLVLHPLSRARLFTTLTNWGDSKVIAGVDQIASESVLPQPKMISDYALWMDVGSRRLVDRLKTEPKDWGNMITAAEKAAALEPDNAFWPQMKAAFLLALKDRARARQEWIAASKKGRWDDGQSRKLRNARRVLDTVYGGASWTGCIVYPKRSKAPAKAIESVARDVARTTPVNTEEGLRIRYATVLNGKLMRDGARSLAVAELGVATIELASYPPNLSSIESPRTLLLTRADLYSSFRDHGMEVAGEETDKAFKDNDSWLAYPGSEEASEDFQSLTLASLVVSGAGPVLTLVAMLGLGLAVVSGLSKQWAGWNGLFSFPWALIAGLGVAGGVHLLTASLLTAVATAAGFAFLAFAPKQTRSHPAMEFGPTHSFLLIVLGALLLLGTAGLVGLFSTPGRELLKAIQFPLHAFGDHRGVVAVFFLFLATTALISCFFAWAHRINAPAVLFHSLEKLGRGLCWGGLVSAVALAPLLFLLDRKLDLEITQRIDNEPVHYVVTDRS